ncbi:MAG: NUDIX domain-containing protein [Rhodospirillaceae bacterium]
MNHDDLDVIARKRVFDGYFKMDEWRIRHKMFNGGRSGEFTRECLERGHAVAVMPYDPVRDEVVLIERFRVGAAASRPSPNWGANPPSPWLIEIVAGIVEDGETPEDVAAREMVKESGCEALALKHICTYLATPGCCSETIGLYAAWVDSSRAGGVHGLDHENEDIRVFTAAAEDAFRMARDGRANNCTLLIALQWLELNRDALRREWGAA